MKVIDQGDATLYEYSSNNKKTYCFSKTPHENVELLIFKEYNIDQNTLKENNQYKQQLSSQLILDQLKKSDFLELK